MRVYSKNQLIQSLDKNWDSFIEPLGQVFGLNSDPSETKQFHDHEPSVRLTILLRIIIIGGGYGRGVIMRNMICSVSLYNTMNVELIIGKVYSLI